MNLVLKSPAAGIAYSLWLRLRWVLIGILSYLAALAAAVQLVPDTFEIALIGTLALSSASAHLLTVFTLGPADIGTRGSGFPKHMFVLPVRTHSLVGWPMLFGAGVITMLWIMVATLILRPNGFKTPVFWPAALAAAGTAWVQAVGWSPFPTPFARVPALALVITPLILLGCCAGVFLENSAVAICIVVASLLWILAAYLFAVQGLSRARSGSEGDWLRVVAARLVPQLRKRDRAAMRPRFRSAFTAQLWHEWRRNAIALVLMISFISLPMIGLSVHSVVDADASKNLMLTSVTISPGMLGLVLLVFMFPLICGLYGPGMGKFDIWGKEAMPPFFAIRPMATSRFVLIKMAGAACGALGAWMFLLMLFAVWALVESSPINPRESLVRTSIANAGPAEIFALFAILLGFLAIAWREMVVGMWLTLTGRKWLSNTLGILSIMIFSLGAIAGGWLYNRPEFQPILRAYIPWLIVTLVTLKLFAVAWVIQLIRNHCIIPTRTMITWLGGWAIGCLSLFALLSFFVDPSATLAGAVILVLPLTRLAASPLALHWNRHR